MTPEEAMREQALAALVDHVLRWPNDPALSPTAWSLAQGYLTLKAERDALKVQIQTVLQDATVVVDENHELRTRLSVVEAERDQLKATYQLLATAHADVLEASLSEALPACPQCKRFDGIRKLNDGWLKHPWYCGLCGSNSAEPLYFRQVKSPT